jgi:hypothetical protein
MKTKNKSGLLTLIFVLLVGQPIFGATNSVTVGSDVQAVINASSPGDMLFMAPGTYTNSLVFSKPLRVAPTAANAGNIQFTGPISIQNTGSNLFQQVEFYGLSESIGAHLTVVDGYYNAPFSANGGHVIMKRVTLTPTATTLLTNNVRFEALRLKAQAPITSYATPFMAVQSHFQQLVTIITGRVWIAYCTTSGSGFFTLNACESLFIGNKFNSAGNTSVVTSQGGAAKLYNNLIVNTSQFAGSVHLNGASGELVNNTMFASYSALSISSPPGPVNLKANIFRSLNYSINLQSASAFTFASHCLFLPGEAPLGLTTPTTGCLFNVDPLMSGDNLSLLPGSPCLNAGTPGAVNNNRDNTRNTIGYTGGPYYNPANHTNDNPMVFLLMGPQYIFKGAQTSIQISGAASAGHN